MGGFSRTLGKAKRWLYHLPHQRSGLGACIRMPIVEVRNTPHPSLRREASFPSEIRCRMLRRGPGRTPQSSWDLVRDIPRQAFPPGASLRRVDVSVLPYHFTHGGQSYRDVSIAHGAKRDCQHRRGGCALVQGCELSKRQAGCSVSPDATCRGRLSHAD